MEDRGYCQRENGRRVEKEGGDGEREWGWGGGNDALSTHITS